MMDEYEAYLRERVEWYTNWCMEDVVAKTGRPGNIKWAAQSMRYSLECYEDALEEYLKFKQKQADDQRWFWSDEWQAGEREADEQIARGEIETFDNIDDFISSLDEEGPSSDV